MKTIQAVLLAFIFTLLLFETAAISSPVGVIDLRDGDFVNRRPEQRKIIDKLGQDSLAPSKQRALFGHCTSVDPTLAKLDRARSASSAGVHEKALALSLDVEVRLINHSRCGNPAVPSLIETLRIQRRSAHKLGLAGTARQANDKLGKLTGSADEKWTKRYPVVDRIGQTLLQIPSTSPSTATLWVDGVPFSGGPLTDNVVLTASAPKHLPKSVRLKDAGQSIELEGDGQQKTRSVAQQMRLNPPQNIGKSLQEILELADFNRVIVLSKTGGLVVWVKGVRSARKVGKTSTASAAISLVKRQPDRATNALTLANSPLPQPATKNGTRWWIYAGALGAAALATGLIFAGGLGSDTQEITVEFPPR